MEKIILENPFLIITSMSMVMGVMFYFSVWLYTIRHKINWHKVLLYILFGWLFIVLAALDGIMIGWWKLYKTALRDITQFES